VARWVGRKGKKERRRIGKGGRRTRRDLWVGFRPNGVGETKPHHYREMLHTIWDNRRRLLYASRIVRKGACDGCALGVAGLHDWTIDGVHLCTTRLNLLKLNTMGALDPAVLADVEKLRKLDGKQLRDLGRLPYPMVRHKGEPGFGRVSWDEALGLIAGRIRSEGPASLGVYLTARGITNETYYAAQKTVRFLGSNNVDNAARVCHAPSTVTLHETLGIGATSVSYTDVIASDLVILFGSNVANAQPVFMKYLYLARMRGAKVIVVNPLREPGLERYWVPSNTESALFGTKMADDFFTVHTGGDLAFLNGVMKVLLATGGLDRAFIREHTSGFDELLAELEQESFTQLEQASGATRADMERFAKHYADAPTAILVWSMGITQHERGSDNVAAIVNLALARGNVGKPGAGVMPIRGHSGVQGGAEMGAYATALPGGLPVNPENAQALSEEWGFPVPERPGLTAAAMIDAAHRGTIEVLYSSGGNFLDVLPDPAFTRDALARLPVRVHQDIVLSSQMLIDPGDVVVLLPAATRYEQRDGGTETTSERRVIFSPSIKGPRIAEARSEWEIWGDLARAVDPERGHLASFESGDAMRREIARVVPMYAGIEDLHELGDAFQWGGERLAEGGVFPTADGRGRFTPLAPQARDVPEGRFMMSTRRGKQFNSMVHQERDPLTGAGRDAVFMAEEDALRLSVRDGSRVLLRSNHGSMRARVHVAAIRPGNVQTYFPEGNVLLGSAGRDRSGVPDYNAVVEIVPI
jgi:molybdopterin-dependent oxidoreductase alpha subunit